MQIKHVVLLEELKTETFLGNLCCPDMTETTFERRGLAIPNCHWIPADVDAATFVVFCSCNTGVPSLEMLCQQCVSYALEHWQWKHDFDAFDNGANRLWPNFGMSGADSDGPMFVLLVGTIWVFWLLQCLDFPNSIDDFLWWDQQVANRWSVVGRLCLSVACQVLSFVSLIVFSVDLFLWTMFWRDGSEAWLVCTDVWVKSLQLLIWFEVCLELQVSFSWPHKSVSKHGKKVDIFESSVMLAKLDLSDLMLLVNCMQLRPASLFIGSGTRFSIWTCPHENVLAQSKLMPSSSAQALCELPTRSVCQFDSNPPVVCPFSSESLPPWCLRCLSLKISSVDCIPNLINSAS